MNKEQQITSLVLRSHRYSVSTHTIAKVVGCTPSYVRKVCWKLFNQGKVAYRTEPHQGNAKIRYMFVSVQYAQLVNTFHPQDEEYTLPACVQPMLINYSIKEDWQND